MILSLLASWEGEEGGRKREEVVAFIGTYGRYYT